MGPSARHPQEINELVALGSTTQFDIPKSRRNPEGDHQVTFLAAGLDALGINHRTARILDAIATVLVSSERGEVYAVGAQIDHQQDKDPREGAVTLFVATNQKVQALAKVYLEEVWSILRTMAKRHRRGLREKSRMLRQNFLDETLPKGNADSQPSEPPDDFCQLIRKVYSHCFRKWVRRVNKSYTAFVRFYCMFIDDILPTLSKSDPIIQPLGYLIHQIRWVHKTVKAFNKDQQDPQQLIYDTSFPGKMVQVQRAMNLLDAKKLAVIDGWNGEDNTPISLYFKKFAGFQAEISQLELFTRSPGMHRILKKYSLVVTCLDEEQTTIELPTSYSSWQAVLKNALDTVGFATNEQSQRVVEGAVGSKVAKQAISQCSVHCECKILKYFASQNLKPRPLSYIGVSKLSCAACASVFAAWNTQHLSDKYLCRGSHGKWYFPWAVPTGWADNPTEDDSDILNAIYTKVADQFAHALNEVGWAERRISDSSVPSSVEDPGFSRDISWETAVDDLLADIDD